jgi:hypothetical protein
MDPRYLSLLTLMLVPGTPLYEQWQRGEFQLMQPEALLRELREILLHLEGLSGCIFRTNHASNYLPLAGTLPKDKPRLLAALDAALRSGPGVASRALAGLVTVSLLAVRRLDAAFALRQLHILHNRCWTSGRERKAQPKRRQAAALQNLNTPLLTPISRSPRPKTVLLYYLNVPR